MDSGILTVVPARLESTRLPRKALVPIAGRPLIEWVWRNLRDCPSAGRIVVATDSEKIVSVVRAFGGEAVMTSPSHRSGTDRVAEVVRQPEFADHTCVLNVQGDEPFVTHDALRRAVGLVRDESWEVGTLATPFSSARDWQDPGQVKVIRATDGRALYFSRAPIPHRRDGITDDATIQAVTHVRHIGVYSYRRDALLRWVSLEEHPIERLERLEQLRALAAGIAIGVGVVEPHPAGVDTPEDLERARSLLVELDTQGQTVGR